MKPWTARPLVVLALMGVAACSTQTPSAPPSGSGSDPGTSTRTTVPVGDSSTVASTTRTPTGPVTTGGDAYPAADVCAYLAGRIPALTAVDSPVGREADLAASLFGFLDDHGIRPDGAQLDAATTTRCPDVRTQILTLTGLASLAQM